MDKVSEVVQTPLGEFIPGQPPPGHQFHFQVFVQGQYRVGDGPRIDEPEPKEYDPFTLTVRASSLAEACRKAAETPLKDWKINGEEQP